MKHSKRFLAALTASAFGLLAGGAQADVFVTADIEKDKFITVDVVEDIYKEVDLYVFEYVAVDSVAEQSVIKNQRNQFNFVEDEFGISDATIDGSVVGASGIVLINQSPGFVNNQGNEVSVTAAKSPGNATFVPKPSIFTPGDSTLVSMDDIGSAAVDSFFEAENPGVFAHAEVAVEQINGLAPGDEDGLPEGGFVNEYVNVFGALLTDTITGSFTDGSGVAGVNQSAGSLNNQNNALAVAIGDSAVYALGEADLGQFNRFNKVDVIDHIRVDLIDGGSFDNFTGVAMVNQSSGFINNQANVIDIAVDAAAVLPDLGNIGGGGIVAP